jgi:bifunctional DNase/RNase
LLFYFDELSIREIAALLGLSMSAVKGRLHRSRQQLRLSLASLSPEATQAVRPLSTSEVAVIKPERTKNMVEVTVADVVNTEHLGEPSGSGVIFGPSASRVVFLFDKSGKRLFPIWIGPFEAEAMAINLLDYPVRRPLTYTLMANLLEASGVALESVSVSEINVDTYIATVSIRVGETVREIDARPSDAINLALQMESPIYVAESVMEKGGIDISDQDALPQGTGLQQLQGDFDEQMRDAEENRHSLMEASEEEIRAHMRRGGKSYAPSYSNRILIKPSIEPGPSHGRLVISGLTFPEAK